MALGRINHVDLLVDDLKKTEEFFTKKLGFKVVRRTQHTSYGGEHIEVVSPDGGEILDIHQIQETYLKEDEPTRPHVHHIAFEVDDLQKTCDEMKSKGVPFKAGDGPNFNSETGGGEATTYDENGRRWIQMMQMGKDDKKDIAKKRK